MKTTSLAPLPPEQLDELAAGLDAGWDTPVPAPVSPGQAPISVSPSVDELDSDWDTEGTEAPPANVVTRVRAKRPRSNASAGQGPAPVRPGAAPLRVSKQERREAERQRLAHQAKQKSASKQQRKAERQEEARRAGEQRRAEQQAQAERRAAAATKAKRAQPVAKRTEEPSPRRAAKQARREQIARAPQADLASLKSAPAPVRAERNSTTLIIIVALALAFGACLWFALSRTAH